MPDVAARVALEARDYPRDHSGVGPDRVFLSGFVRRGRNRRPGEPELAGSLVGEPIEAPQVQDLETNQMKMEMKMDRMRIVGAHTR